MKDHDYCIEAKEIVTMKDVAACTCHNINNPLAIAEMIANRMGGKDPSEKELEMLRGSIRRIGNYVDQLQKRCEELEDEDGQK